VLVQSRTEQPTAPPKKPTMQHDLLQPCGPAACHVPLHPSQPLPCPAQPCCLPPGSDRRHAAACWSSGTCPAPAGRAVGGWRMAVGAWWRIGRQPCTCKHKKMQPTPPPRMLRTALMHLPCCTTSCHPPTHPPSCRYALHASQRRPCPGRRGSDLPGGEGEENTEAWSAAVSSWRKKGGADQGLPLWQGQLLLPTEASFS